jgi:hypothetical protein
MLYFSRGSLRGNLRRGDSVSPEALGSESIQIRPRNRVAVEVVENLIALLKVGALKAGSDPRLTNFTSLKSPPAVP